MKKSMPLSTPKQVKSTIKIKHSSKMGIRKMNKSVKLSPAFEETENESPIRPVFCLKKKDDLKRIEEVEECFILDFDPFETNNFTNLSISKDSDEIDVSVLAENGKVACRDYPHPRHLCAKYPFENTPHQSNCKMCYCYVCEKAAPCNEWTTGMRHCDATDNCDETWRLLKAQKNETKS